MTIRNDIRVYKERDPAVKHTLDLLLNSHGLYALWCYRLANRLWKIRLRMIGRVVSNIGRLFTGVEIHPGATIGKGFFIDHGIGIVIGETAEIGDNCSIYQGATLGGTSWKKGKRHPTLEEGVIIGAGAKVLGPIRIGRCAKIGSNAVVTRNTPNGATVVGVPGQIIKRRGAKTIHAQFTPYADTNSETPLEKHLQELTKRVTELENIIATKVPKNETTNSSKKPASKK